MSVSPELVFSLLTSLVLVVAWFVRLEGRIKELEDRLREHKTTAIDVRHELQGRMDKLEDRLLSKVYVFRKAWEGQDNE